jgi:hypothetical protein
MRLTERVDQLSIKYKEKEQEIQMLKAERALQKQLHE